MRRLNRGITRALTVSLMGLVLLGGCFISREKTTERQVPVSGAGSERIVTYPEGRYVLYGDGRAVPYYWVWVPAGTTEPVSPPPPPALPAR